MQSEYEQPWIAGAPSALTDVGLAQAQIAAALKGAPDGTVVAYKGTSKTLSQWRSDLQAAHKPPDPSVLNQLTAQQQAEFDAEAKALQDQQDADLAAQNAKVDKDFEQFTAQ